MFIQYNTYFFVTVTYSGLKDTYRRVAVFGVIGYIAWAVSVWFATREETFYTCLYVFISISLFCLMTATLYDMKKMICSWRYYPICFCVPETSYASHHNKRMSTNTVKSSTIVDLKLVET